MAERDLQQLFINNVLYNGRRGGLPVLPASACRGTFPSFDFDGSSASEVVASWNFDSRGRETPERIFHTLKWTKPDGSFEVCCEATEFRNHPAVEWVLHFRNTGSANSPQISNIMPMDFNLDYPRLPGSCGYSAAQLHYCRGSDFNFTDFEPLVERFRDNHKIVFDCRAGRTSDPFLPFWNLDCHGWGMVCAVGWSGSWKAEIEAVTANGRSQMFMRAGLAHADFHLKPGEEVRSPAMCVLFWEGPEPLRGHNLFRRFMRDQIMPKWNAGDPTVIGILGGADVLERVQEKNQLGFINEIAKVGANVYWLDAGWYASGRDGTWGSGRGNWFHDTAKFPNGLKPLGEEAHKNGIKFLLWFDPEVVSPETAIAREHPEWIIRPSPDGTGLFNLGIPAARAYLADLLSADIEKYGVDVFRNDFNIEPGPFWARADEPGRKGLTEIRYVEGLYWLWDELRKRHPHLLIDNCASGGRRIDYETCKRAVPLWRSDAQCFPNDPLLPINNQNQAYGLSLYLPAHAGGTHIIPMGQLQLDTKPYPEANLSAYNFRSGMTSSIALIVGQETFAGPMPVDAERLKARIDEIKSLQRLFLCDYYPLTPFSLGDDCWMACQFDDPKSGQGFALFFRREKAPFEEATFELRAFADDATYCLTYVDTGVQNRGLGKELKKVAVRLEPVSSALIRYRRVGQRL